MRGGAPVRRLPEATPMAGTPETGGGRASKSRCEVYQMYFAGGVSAEMGTTAEAVIDLIPGRYVVWGDDPSAPQKP